MREIILSVGIDIGTSTTQIVFSEITIENLASDFSVPRIEIINKKIIYRSNIYFTPLKSPAEIDMEKVKEIVEKEYSLASINFKDIKTGAVVITGETARKENANEVLQILSGFAGDFVVATAGPDLESIIAAKGAGVDVYSKNSRSSVANFDIGGGTSNFALFEKGELVTTGCLDIGGRLIKVDKSTNKITYIADKIKELAIFKNITINEGDSVNISALKEIAKAMAEILEMSLGVKEKSSFYHNMNTLKDKDIKFQNNIQNIAFSGGVADYIYNPSNEDIFKYGDLGILLGSAIVDSDILKNINLIKPTETIRATVVGAGSHITDISGSTINYDEKLLPLKNIPILKLTKDEEMYSISQAIKEKLTWFNFDGEQEVAAIALKGSKSLSFTQITKLANSIVEGSKMILENNLPFIVVIETDLAKVLGQTIRNCENFKGSLVCIDSIKVDNGDYIDIGKPIANGSVVPVIIKTLIFK